MWKNPYLRAFGANVDVLNKDPAIERVRRDRCLKELGLKLKQNFTERALLES